jgi:tRNA pseudouridine38-40 synthase
MPRYALLFAYNGTPFYGWQAQEGLKTVQGDLEQALNWVLRTPVCLMAAGRTDRGVHAEGQVAHFDCPEMPLTPEELRRRVNAILFPMIAVREAVAVDEQFHARFSAIWRQYRYDLALQSEPLRHETTAVYYGNPDRKLLHVMAGKLVGTHDLLGFSKESEQHKGSICEVHSALWYENEPGRLIFRIRANRFLHHTVRGLVGTMWEVSTGKMSLEDFDAVLHKADRTKCGFTALAKGLVLERVGYKEFLFKTEKT